MRTKNKTRKKTKQRIRKKTKRTAVGGEAIAAGGFGCVFKPALKCKDKASRTIGISKLLTDRDATDEMKEIKKIKPYLSKIPNFEKYFLINDITSCSPMNLTADDKKNFDKKCNSWAKRNIVNKNITASNINSNLTDLKIINMVDGGIDVKGWLSKEPLTNARLVTFNNIMITLLLKGVKPMNDQGVIHHDLKDTNILIDERNDARIIDWGLVGVSTDAKKVPSVVLNRPIQYNTPFSSMLISNTFLTKYSEYLKYIKSNDIAFSRENLRIFALNRYFKWLKEKGEGHNEYLNMVFKDIFKDQIESAELTSKKLNINTFNAASFYYYFMAKYIVDILATHSTVNGFAIVKYFTEVYIHNADVWGLCSAYFVLFSAKTQMGSKENKLFLNRLRDILVENIFTNGGRKIDVEKLARELKSLNAILGGTPTKPLTPIKTLSKPKSTKKTKKRCPKGSRRDKKTGKCKNTATGTTVSTLP